MGEYFKELMNEENDFEVDDVQPIEGPIKEVDKNEVRQAVGAMKTGKAAGPTGLTTEMMKAAGESGVIEFTKVLADVWKKETIPDEWKRSLTVTIYKGKGDPLQCNSYRGIRLLEHPMKVMEKVLENRLREIVNIDKWQRGFMKGRSTTDAIHVLRQLQEKYVEKKRTLFHVFVDLEKAFDRVPRKVIVWALRRQGVPEKLIHLVMSLYEDSNSCVRKENGDSTNFPISVGVHQGSALSPLLFIVVMEEISKECRRGAPWEMLFADDLVLTSESEDEVKDMFLNWRTALERRGLKVNLGKTKLLVSGDKKENEETGRYPCAVCRKGVGSSSIQCSKCRKWVHKRCSGMRTLTNMTRFQCSRCTNTSESGRTECGNLGIGDECIERVDRFCYLGDMMSSNRGTTDAVRTRVKAMWSKWRQLSSLLLNKSIPLKIRGMVYRTCLRPVMCYGSETWAMTKANQSILEVTEMRMLRWMCRVKLEDQVSNIEVLERVDVEKLENILRRNRLRWFGHVERRGKGSVLKTVEDVEVDGVKPRGRPKNTWKKTIEEDLKKIGLQKNICQDRETWRHRIRV